ncbi:hypothetical protein [Mesorhizobium amorphae]|uniref:hypothetical protein n=1 Tax=Mesorhizobium amorphae TaxID=71433 RepID=UPI0021B3BFB8|nr:hypothetical protein [Mesorhizobium amorphae]
MMGEPKMVILDEPTSSLAAAEVEQVFSAVRRMREHGIALIYVSHRMNEIREIADTASVMRDGRIVSTLDIGTADTSDIVRMMLGHDERKDDLVIPRSAGGTLLAMRNISYPPKLRDISFDLRRGEVLGIAACSGRGGPSCSASSQVRSAPMPAALSSTEST